MAMTTQMLGLANSNHAARETILEAARSFLLSSDSFVITRQQIARLAGVSPGLVSACFRDKNALLTAAIGPVISSYVERLSALAWEPCDYNARLRDLILIFLEFNARHSRFLGHYMAAHRTSTSNDNNPDMIVSAYFDILRFFRRGMAAGCWRPMNPVRIQACTWALCKHFAESPPSILGLDEDRDSIATRADAILDMLSLGITSQAPVTSEPDPS